MRKLFFLLLPILIFGYIRGGKVTNDTLYRYWYLYPGDVVTVFDSVNLDSVETCTSDVYIYQKDTPGIFSVAYKITSTLGAVSARLYYTVALDTLPASLDTIPNHWKIVDSLYNEYSNHYHPVKSFYPSGCRVIRFYWQGLVPNRSDTRIKMKFGTFFQ